MTSDSFLHGIFWGESSRVQWCRSVMTQTQFKADTHRLIMTLLPLENCHFPGAWWLDWTLRNHILSNRWMYHRIRWGTCYKQIFKLTHRLRFSRPGWLPWWILPNSEGENNANSSQILPENWKGRILPNSLYEDITLIQKPDKDIMRKLKSPLSLTNNIYSLLWFLCNTAVEVLAIAEWQEKEIKDIQMGKE